MLVCRDLEPVRRLLLANEPATRSIYNTIFRDTGANPARVRVDDRENPKVALCRAGWLTLYASSVPAGKAALDSLPARWNFAFSATPSWAYRHAVKTRDPRWHNDCFGFALTDPRQLKARQRHRVGFLEPGDSRLVTRHWPYHSSRRDSPYIRWRIEHGPTAAVRRRGRPVAWALTHGDGSLGFLHVLEEYRGQGMARSIAAALCRRSVRAGIMPFLFIEKKNRPSLRLTESLGFERVGSYSWFSAGPKKRA